ncbi:hypothetical protein PFICI_02950 [Pestalotiopsis fici W106-1]|uniref:Uncharacterized protein n=1 Tax=Pestalotiopsis fici (strain W106-1 / CGMCC3.15140) TaxID=1229662 RepID=W3XFW4_PESFW|nr:uncharacterized protein PFICI_02950 [Pestalotiopsis fici W106-1]ETS84925.1 hypothetical protein PFICI_02950 [Pestalotiopsis fici W106-1]
MITRGLSSGAICLGCRLRLLGQSVRPNLSQSISQQGRSSSLYQNQRRRWLASDAPARPDERDEQGNKSGQNDWSLLEQASRDQANEEQAYRDFLEQEDEFPDVRERRPGRRGSRSLPRQARRDSDQNSSPMMRHLDLRKKVLSGRKILTETSASLGSDMLGKPAYAIVMKDTGKYRAKKRPVGLKKSAQKDEMKDIEALLDNRRIPATEAEVRQNIDELRPPNSELILRQKNFLKLQTNLEEGFLKEQLQQYILSFQSDPSVEPTTTSSVATQKSEETKLKDQYPWISNAVPWMPVDPYGGVAVLHDHSSRLLHAYLPPDAGPKTRAAVRIMRECWGLQMEEVANGLGEARIRLQTKHFIPLMRSSQKLLRSITETYLEEGEALETLVPTNEIRIRAPRYKYETLLFEIDALIGKLQSHTFPISHVTSDPTTVTEELLELVGKVTNTHVRLTDTRNRLQVTWIQLSTQYKPEVETLSHVVFRFLRNALYPDSATRTLHTTNAEIALAAGGTRLIADHSHKEKWAWKDRLSSWARLASPISAPNPEIKRMETTSTEPVLPNFSIPIEQFDYTRSRSLEVTAETLNLSSSESPTAEGVAIQESSRFPYQPVRWSDQPKTTTVGKFGHALTMYDKKADSTGTFSNQPGLGDLAARPYNFSPVVPHPLTMADLSLSPANENDFIPTASTIVVRFFHNHESAFRALPLVAPPLELRLSLSEPSDTRKDPEITGVHSLRVVSSTHHDDVLFPASPVDLRITQTRSVSLQGSPGALQDWQPIADFLARSHLDFGAGKLEMAKQQRFQIPLRLFHKAAASNTNTNNKEHGQRQEEEASPESLRSTLYEFAGLELHRSVSVPYPEDERFKLVYTSIEAGQGGGRRAELSLEPASRAHLPLSTEAGEYHDDFLRACSRFAQTAKNWSGYIADSRVKVSKS